MSGTLFMLFRLIESMSVKKETGRRVDEAFKPPGAARMRLSAFLC